MIAKFAVDYVNTVADETTTSRGIRSMTNGRSACLLYRYTSGDTDSFRFLLRGIKPDGVVEKWALPS